MFFFLTQEEGIKIKANVYVTRFLLILFGLFLSVILIEAGLRLSGYAWLKFNRNDGVPVESSSDDTIRILCLGESTTAGQWPGYLTNSLNVEGIDFHVSVFDRARPGVDSYFLASRIDRFLSELQPDIVIGMIGVNDSDKTLIFESGDREPDFRFFGLLQILHERLFPDRAVKSGEVSGSDELDAPNVKEQQRIKEYSQFDPVSGSMDDVLFGTLMDRVARGRIIDIAPQVEKLLEKYPKSVSIKIGLSHCYHMLGRSPESIQLSISILDDFPSCEMAFDEYADYLLINKEFSLLLEVVENALAAADPDQKSHFLLFKAEAYRMRGERAKADELYMRVLSDKDICLRDKVVAKRGLSSRRESSDGDESAGNVHETIFKLRSATLRNYNYIIKRSLASGADFVVMSYPLNNVDVLREKVYSDERVSFIDNTAAFEDALKLNSYEDVFFDSFGLSWGHSTELGNKLIAENVNLFLKEYISERR